MRTMICGNSHVGSLAKGHKLLGLSDDAITLFPLGTGRKELHPFHEVTAAGVRFSEPSYQANLEKFTGRAALGPDVRWGFCMGSHSGRLFRGRFWKWAEPDDICRPKKRPISAEVLEACIESDQRHVRAFLAAVKDAGIPLFVIACPPARDDNPAVDRGLRPEVIRHIDQRALAAFTAFLAENNIDFVAFPPEVVDRKGFLAEKYRLITQANGQRDAHHGNEAYGAVMMRRVADYLDR